MNKFWCLLFLAVPVLGVAAFAWAPGAGYWLPRDISDHGWQIDHLFYFVLTLTGAVFVATELALFWFAWKYDGRTNMQPVRFTHGSHDVEVLWTLAPAATLVFIAIYQMNAWADVKMRQPDVPVLAEVTARQFEWRIRYPGADGRFDTLDDVHVVNDLHVPVDRDILITLKSQDVLHSFFLPNLRIKQDAVPGMKIPVWFRARDVGEFDLVCAELCGWGHYKMKGRLTVQSASAFQQWLAETAAAQEATQEPEVEESE
ncbi:MAG: cytochrome c oxidase subunit II [Pirellulales bacterium]|nr:cytochrome c oxidase subunit II [Pirellulales bacterium]